MAKTIGNFLGVDWEIYSLEEFRRGMEVEMERGAHDPETDVPRNDPLLIGKITWAHLKELPDYYTRLDCMWKEAQEELKD